MEKEKKWNSGRILSTSSRFWHSCTIHAGVRLEVFSHIGEKKLGAVEVAGLANASERGMTILLNALAAMGLLTGEDGLFANTESARELLDKKSPRYLGYIIMHHHHLVDGWQQLDQAVVTGEPVETKSHGEEKERESFQLGMFNIAMAIAPRLADIIDLSSRRHLLDLGGGPGTHAIFFCKANPELRATIFDRATTEPFARKTTEKFGVADRIDFIAGDFNRDDIPGRYDAAWLSQILHSNSYEECERLIAKTVSVLEPGGEILVHDFHLNDTMDGPLFPALFSLNMLINNHGRSYSEKEVRSMMEKAGAGNIERLPFSGPNESSVLRGIVR